MRKRIMLFSLGVFAACFPGGCSHSPNEPRQTQFLQIQFQYYFRDELNTFEGTLQKDLVMDGVIKVPFWLSRSEQQAILDKAQAIGFFSFPDTLFREPGIAFSPDPSPDILRIRYQQQEKSVVWFYPMDSRSQFSQRLRELADLIRQSIESKPEYKRLPQARGGYL